ncbi:MAG: FHA domain-containing protein [Planctomycetes bacterium]|jgi:adenylate cyclase|nr:FHA domain-containing protein [Planctomycetota bacterium]
MDAKPNGELIPQGGGDSVPLTRSPLIVGRREACDICLPFPTLSGRHCELTFKEGHWIIRDLDSTNGTSVNGAQIQKKILHSGDAVSFGSRNFTLQYTEMGRRSNLDEFDEELEEVMSMSLLEKAGLAKPRRHPVNPVLTTDDASEQPTPVPEPPAAETRPETPPT